MHIRSLGNWTNKLFEYFTNVSNYNKLFEIRERKSGPQADASGKVTKRESNQPEESDFRTKRKMSSLVVLTDFKKADDFGSDDFRRIENITEEVSRIVGKGMYV